MLFGGALWRGFWERPWFRRSFLFALGLAATSPSGRLGKANLFARRHVRHGIASAAMGRCKMENEMAEIPPDVQADVRLEKEVAKSSNPRLRMLLIETLADRYTSISCEKYLERLRLHMQYLPPDDQHFALAFLAAVDGRSDEARQHFVRYAERILEHEKTPPDSDFAWRFVQRQSCVVAYLDDDAFAPFWKSVSALFAGMWPNAPLSLFYEAVATLLSSTDEEARRGLSDAFSKIPDFWTTSRFKALMHIDTEEWQDAAKCLWDAMEDKNARRDPALCFDASCVFLKANRKDHAKEAVVAYLDCLESALGGSGSPSADAVSLVNGRVDTAWADEAVARAYLQLLAKAANDRWGETAYAVYLAASVILNEDDTEGALRQFVRAISLDRTFWLAALAAARVYTAEDNWKSAAGWFRCVLQAEGARLYADVWFEAAWCFGRAKSRDEEIDAYRRCLDCIPDYEYGTNNLGWALLKAGEYEEAVEVLRRAMQLETERRYAISNLARALKKLERYQEAIDVLRGDKTKKEKLRKYALKEIAKLEELLKSKRESMEDQEAHAQAAMQEQVEVAPEIDDGEAEKEERQAGPPEGDEGHGVEPKPSGKTKRSGVPLEKILESLIEEKILRGEVVFNRKLRMHESSDGFYGRQYPIPGIGFIDLLAEDLENGDLVVIELKRALGTREVIGQVSEYAGWVKNNLAKPEQKVVPVICLHEANEQLKNAAEVVGIEVLEYDLSFH